MRRRSFLAAALPFALAACATTQVPKNYPHMVLNSATVAQYPDDVRSVEAILGSDGFKGRDVVVELVAGWCKPCKQQQPRMDAALAALAAQGAPIARLTIYYEERDRRLPAYKATFNSLTKSKTIPQVQVWRDAQPLPESLIGGKDRAEIETFIKDHLAVPAQAPA